MQPWKWARQLRTGSVVAQAEDEHTHEQCRRRGIPSCQDMISPFQPCGHRWLVFPRLSQSAHEDIFEETKGE